MLGPALLGVVCTLLLSGSKCEVWSRDSLENNAMLYVCSSRTLHLFWNFSLEAGETLTDVKWYYQGRSDELIAMFSSGAFLPLPAFAQRASHSGNGGLRISHVTNEDSGVYSVEVEGHRDDGTFFTFRRSAVIRVGDDLMTEGGHLHVTQNPTAVLDPSSNLWSVALLCGRFMYEHPPFQVEWLTPSGSAQASSDYANGYFRLLLPDHVTSGSFTCRVPEQQATMACLHGNQTGEASLEVDSTEARLALLEARQSILLSENEKLKEENRNLNASVSQLLESKEDLIQETNVSFHVRLPKQLICNYSQVLNFSDVILNNGDAYNVSSGVFTAPVSAVFVFLFAVGSVSPYDDADALVKVDGEFAARLYEVRNDHGGIQISSVPLVLRLTQGQQVWVECFGINMDFWKEVTSWSGFLLNVQP